MKNMIGILAAVALCWAPTLNGQDDPAKREQDKPQMPTKGSERDTNGMEAFLSAHPGLRAKLKDRADLNHDGRLSPRERAYALQLLKEKHEAWRKARRLKWLKKHPEEAKRLRDRIDRDHDGVVEPDEVRRAKRVKDHIDRDGDGVVERNEVRKAKRVKDRVDRNDDGKVGPRERQRAKKVVKKAVKKVRKQRRKH